MDTRYTYSYTNHPKSKMMYQYNKRKLRYIDYGIIALMSTSIGIQPMSNSRISKQSKLNLNRRQGNTDPR